MDWICSPGAWWLSVPLLVVVLTLHPAVVLAEETLVPQAKLVVDVEPDHENRLWIALAFEQNVTLDLAGFQRLAAVDKADVDTSECPRRKRECLLSAYAAAGIDVVMLGRLSSTSLEYEVLETWLGSQVTRGSLTLGPGSNLLRVRQRTLAALGPFFESGGLIDKKPFLQRKHAPAASVPQDSPHGLPTRWLVLLLVATLLIVSPLGVARVMTGPQRSQRYEKHTLRLGMLLIIGALAAALWIAAIPPGSLQKALDFFEAHSIIDFDQLLAILGGLMWGWLARILLRLIFPRLFGIRQVRHRNVGPLLKSWALVSCMRLLLVSLFCLPFVGVTWGVATLLEQGVDRTLLTLAPAVGLIGYYWWLSLIDHLSAALDSALVEGQPTPGNAWHRTTRKYFMGYVRRQGLDLGRRFLEKVLFLPGPGEGVVAYGGGLGRPRIVINRDILDLALGQALEEEIDLSEPPIVRGALPLGMAVPSVGDADDPPLPRRWHRRAARLRARSMKASTLRRTAVRLRYAPQPRLIGENATTLGYLMPLSADETVPLVANDSEDFGVVRQLLTEHYGAFEKGWFGDEYDDTDPTQKDFLFGALLGKIGRIQRGDTLLSTFLLVWRESSARLPGFVQKTIALFGDLIARLFSRHPAILADAYTALNHGRDHLIQYLSYARSDNPEGLTARADAPRLVRTSHMILKAVAKKEATGIDTQTRRATARNRLVWLSRYFHSPIPETRNNLLGVVALLAMLGGAVALLAFAVNVSVEYHTIYVERLQQQQNGPDDGQEEGRPRDVNEN